MQIYVDATLHITVHIYLTRHRTTETHRTVSIDRVNVKTRFGSCDNGVYGIHIPLDY